MEHPHEFPLRETCNLDDPEEAFLWMLVAMPFQKGAPLMMPVEYLRMLSQRLWDCGARPTGVPVIKYQPPSEMDPHWMVAPGTWVPINQPAAAPPTPWDEMSQHDKIRAIAAGRTKDDL